MHCFCLDTYIYPFFLTFQLGLTADKQCNLILLHLTMTCRLHLLGHREGIAHLLKLRPAKVRHHARNVFEGNILETPLWYPLAHLQNLCFKIEKPRKPLNNIEHHKQPTVTGIEPGCFTFSIRYSCSSGAKGSCWSASPRSMSSGSSEKLPGARKPLWHYGLKHGYPKMEWLNQET